MPEPPEEPVTRPGDLWLLGEHRLLCGDATVLADVERVLGGAAGRHGLLRPALQCRLRQHAQGQAARQAPPDPERQSRRRLRGVPARRLHQPPQRDQGCDLHLHEQLRAAHAAAGVRGRRRQVVDLRDLGQAHLHPRPGRLPAAVRADPLRLARGQRPLLVRRPRPGRRLVLRQAGQERPAPDHEAGGAGRAGDPQLEQEPRHRAGPVRRLGLDPDRGREDRAPGAAGRARSEVRRRDRPALAGVQRRHRDPGRRRPELRRDRRRARALCTLRSAGRCRGRRLDDPSSAAHGEASVDDGERVHTSAGDTACIFLSRRWWTVAATGKRSEGCGSDCYRWRSRRRS